MEKIYLDDINLRRLRKVTGVDHRESTLFHNKTTIYKIYDDLDEYKLGRKQRKIELLGDGESLPITMMPKSKIFSRIPIEMFSRTPIEIFEGVGMDYISSQTLYKKFRRNKDTVLLFGILDTVSRSVMQIHQDPRNIVISDLHAQNIIVDRDYNPYIVDIDSCKIDGIKNDTAPVGLKNYLSKRGLYISLSELETTSNTDRFCLLIMALDMLFHKNFDKISLYEYDEKSEEIETLKNMRELVVELQTSSIMPELPYFHELIKSSDTYSRRLKK